MIIGIVGGIGSGKTAVAHFFEKKGAQRIDADAIGHELYAPNTPTHTQILGAFGHEIVNTDGTINRTKLGDIAFSDPEKLQKLNMIMLPKIRDAVVSQVNSAAQNEIIVIDAALLFEMGLESITNIIIAVVAGRELRYRRLIAKGMSHDKIHNIMDMQAPQSTLVAHADYIIDNTRSLADACAQVDTIWEEIVEETDEEE